MDVRNGHAGQLKLISMLRVLLLKLFTPSRNPLPLSLFLQAAQCNFLCLLLLPIL